MVYEALTDEEIERLLPGGQWDRDWTKEKGDISFYAPSDADVDEHGWIMLYDGPYDDLYVLLREPHKYDSETGETYPARDRVKVKRGSGSVELYVCECESSFVHISQWTMVSFIGGPWGGSKRLMRNDSQVCQILGASREHLGSYCWGQDGPLGIWSPGVNVP